MPLVEYPGSGFPIWLIGRKRPRPVCTRRFKEEPTCVNDSIWILRKKILHLEVVYNV